MNRFHRWYCRSGHWGREVRDRTLPWVLGAADLGDDVLEIGAGPGLVTKELRKKAQRLTSLEIDPALAAGLHAEFDGTNVTVALGDATRMSFEDETFSGAVSMSMLHHVPSPELQDELLAEAHRVLRPGAVLAGCDSRVSPLFRLAHIRDTMVPCDPATFSERLESAGFHDIRVDVASRAFRFRAVA